MFLRVLYPLSFLLLTGLNFPITRISETAFTAGSEGDTGSTSSFHFYPALQENEQLTRHCAFALSYSERHEQARWVAYMLTAAMCDNNGEERSNNFRADKSIPTQSALPEDYKKSGYDRGHLCPAGDMGWSEQSMSESFLMSNMSPQQPGFNRGIWKRLETRVREWAKESGELYVVTGGVLKDDLPVIGSSCVSVPEYYYKVLLDYQQPSLKAIAFVLPNKSCQSSFFDYAVSIDSVERLTGIDFFPAIPDSLEDHLEQSCLKESWK